MYIQYTFVLVGLNSAGFQPCARTCAKIDIPPASRLSTPLLPRHCRLKRFFLMRFYVYVDKQRIEYVSIIRDK